MDVKALKKTSCSTTYQSCWTKPRIIVLPSTALGTDMKRCHRSHLFARFRGFAAFLVVGEKMIEVSIRNECMGVPDGPWNGEERPHWTPLGWAQQFVKVEFGVALPALLQGCRWTLWHERFSAEQPHRRSKWNKTGITRWSDFKRLQSLEKALKEIDINVWNLGMSWDGASGDNPVRRTEGYLQGRQPWKNPEHHLFTVKISNNYILYKSNRTSSHSNIYQVSRGNSLPGVKQFDFFVFPEDCLVLVLPELLDHPGFEARDRRGVTFASQWCKQLRNIG